MRWAFAIGIVLVLLLAGGAAFLGTPSRPRPPDKELLQASEADAAPLGGLESTFGFDGRSEAAFCVTPAGECVTVSEGANSPWLIESTGDTVRIEGNVEEIRAPVVNTDVGAVIHVWLLDGAQFVDVSMGNRFEFGLPQASDTLSLRVTFQGRSDNAPSPYATVFQARDFHVEGILYLA